MSWYVSRTPCRGSGGGAWWSACVRCCRWSCAATTVSARRRCFAVSSTMISGPTTTTTPPPSPACSAWTSARDSSTSATAASPRFSIWHFNTSLQVCVQLQLTTWHCSCLLLNAVLLRRPAAAATDHHFLPAGPTAANAPQRHVAIDRWDRQTDGHRTLHRPCRILCDQRQDFSLLWCYSALGKGGGVLW